MVLGNENSVPEPMNLDESHEDLTLPSYHRMVRNLISKYQNSLGGVTEAELISHTQCITLEEFSVAYSQIEQDDLILLYNCGQQCSSETAAPEPMILDGESHEPEYVPSEDAPPGPYQ